MHASTLGALWLISSFVSCSSVPAVRATPVAAAPAEERASVAPADPAPAAPVAPADPSLQDEPAAPEVAVEPRSSRASSVQDDDAGYPREPSLSAVEDRARAAFLVLSPDEQREVCDWLALEVGNLGTFQQRLMQYMLVNQERDAGTWPAYAEPEWYEPATHAPAQPIPRERLDRNDARARAVRTRFLANVAPRRLQSAWRYDYATRELQRLPDEGDARRVFENALLGLPPQWDLAEALVERMRDDGSLQKSFEAFDHAYTDRDGAVYPGVTLYDAWGSKSDLEMPDVDCVGIIHVALDDWTTWKAVIPASQQEPLYARIASLFQDAQHHRGLRHNLARAFLCGSTELRDDYQPNLDRFHALWESVNSEPARLAEQLPAPEEWSGFLQSWADTLDQDLERFWKGVNRRYTLDRDAAVVRQTLLSVLDQFGAYERLDGARREAGH